MLRALLFFVGISTVFSLDPLNCQPNLQHDAGILSKLSETFYFQMTTSTNVIKCEKSTWTGSGNSLEATIQSPGCCRRIHTPIYTSDYVNFTVTPINPLPGCLQTTETVTFKTVAMTTGSDDDLCITCSATRQERTGIFVICRKQIVEQTLLDGIISIVKNLVAEVIDIICTVLGVPPLVYNKVSQENCPEFPPNNCG